MLYKSKNLHGGDIYGDKIILDYSANTNPFGTPLGVKQAIIDILDSLDRYPDPYCRRLLGDLAEHEGVPIDYLICGNGAAEIIYSYCKAVAAKTAVELAPTFAEYSLGLEAFGTKLKRYFLTREKGFKPDDELLDFIEKEKPDVLFLCHPNNPTGQIIEEKLLIKIVKLSKKLDIRVFLDECFLDLASRGFDVKPLLSDNPQLFILKAFTKSYGMAGVRLGYGMTSDNKLLSKMSEAVQPWNVSTVAQAAGIAALKEEKFLKDTKVLIMKERLWLREELETLGYWSSDSVTNYILFQGEKALADKLKTQGIAIRKCDNYHGLNDRYYRIAVRTHEENMKLISTIKEVTKNDQTQLKTAKHD